MTVRSFLNVLTVAACAAVPAVAQNLVTAADGEQLFTGTLLEGDYRSTFADDGVSEVLREVETGGKPTNRTSLLEHRWTLTLPEGQSHTLHFKASITNWGEGDGIELWWAVGTSTPMLLLDYPRGASGTVGTASLPAYLAGPVQILLRDSDRTPGNRLLDTLSIDWLAVETVPTGGPVAPAAPTDARADGKSEQTIAVGWTDNSIGELGFRIERSAAGLGLWQLAGSVAADETLFVDSGLLPSAAYDYRVIAFTATEDSDPSGTATGTTRAAGSFASERIVADRALGAGNLLPYGTWDHDVDSGGKVGVAATDEGNGLYHFECDPGSGAWSHVLVHPDSFQGDCSIAFGAGDTPQISFRDSALALRFAERVNGTWQTVTIDGSQATFMPTLTHDPAGRPVVAYGKLDRQDEGLWVIRRDAPGGGWSAPEHVDAEPNRVGGAAAFAPNGDLGVAYLAWFEGKGKQPGWSELRFARRGAAGWQIEVVATGGEGTPGLSFHPLSGRPTIAWRKQVGNPGEEVWLWRRDAAGWSAERVAEGVVGDGHALHLAHDPGGQERLAFQRADWNAQQYTGSFLLTCVPGAASEEVIDPLGVGPDRPSLHVDALGQVTLVYAAWMFPPLATENWMDDAWLMFAQR